MKFVGVKQFKQDAVKYLNEGNEIVAMNRKRSPSAFLISRSTPVWGLKQP